jgi:hypothetical protein
MGFEVLCPGVPQNLVWNTTCPMSLLVTEYYISDNEYKQFDFPMAGENIHLSRTAINQPLTARNTTVG